ncbi:MAG: NADH:flavin oxidoreductase [Anaerolineae bacterium]|jgi:2,4-dienoyl-CoA reductase-like NADH-dependent reductase (Old Yellow Enzyme family)|nr:NADH:flavin oxidoreductase [Anaerolineae bacterium]MDH7474541.1 NADH:flavin oxidoreductase [Anaerolineae bacterium]
MKIFEPGHIGSLELKNRLVRSATSERMADEAGRPEPPMVEMYTALAQGGVGLIITGHAYVHPSGKAHPAMTSVYDDDLIPALQALSEAVHRQGGKVVMQINHAGRQTSAEIIGQKPLAPSPIARAKGAPRPQEMTEAQIEEIIRVFGLAAGRAKAAGFDGVQIHAAHGYLINQFNSPAANWRRDRWGKDAASRLRFFEQVVQAVRQEVGDDYPVLTKLGIQDFVRDGMTLYDGLEIVRHLADWGIDAVEISGGLGSANTRPDILRPEDEAYFLSQARMARQVTDLPILLVGGLRSREIMERILEEGTADFISLCRPLIREPDLPKRLQAGQEKAACVSCNRCWPPPGEYGVKCRHEG